MKKMLSLMASLALVSTASVTVIACGEQTVENTLTDLSTLKADLQWFNEMPTHEQIVERFNEINQLDLELNVDVIVANLSIGNGTATIQSVKGTAKVNKSLQISWNVRRKINSTIINLSWLKNYPTDEQIIQAVLDVPQNVDLTKADLVIESRMKERVVVKAINNWQGSVAVTWRLSVIPTIYVDENGVEQETKELDLSTINTKEIIQIGYYKDGDVVQAIQLPATVEVVPTSISKEITSLAHLFDGATRFNQDLSQWDVSTITDMNSMFKGATKFDQKLSNWDITSVTDLSYMFADAKSFNNGAFGITREPLSWKMSDSVVNMAGMFDEAYNFNQDISSWNVTNVTNMNHMFSNAKAFNQDLSQWDVSNVTDLSWMFNEADSFNQDLSQWNISAATDLGWMFSEAKNFNNGSDGTVEKPLTWTMSDSVINMAGMFDEAYNFNQQITYWNVTNVTNMNHMFSNAKAFNQDLSQWDVSNVVDLSWMFNEADSFNQDLSQWNISAATDLGWMFSEAKNFNNGSDGTVEKPLTWTMSDSIVDLGWMFNSAVNFNQDISSWNVTNVTNMNSMFKGATIFNNGSDGTVEKPLTWTMSDSIVDLGWMFSGASAFNQDLSSWNVANVTNMEYLFNNAANFNQDISSWNINKVKKMGWMFNGAKSFNQDLSSWILNFPTPTDFDYGADSWQAEFKPKFSEEEINE